MDAVAQFIDGTSNGVEYTAGDVGAFRDSKALRPRGVRIGGRSPLRGLTGVALPPALSKEVLDAAPRNRASSVVPTGRLSLLPL